MTDTAYHRLRGEILHGDLLPGERLRVADLQDRFGLGLTPIREALLRLTGDGLLATEIRRGARVLAASRGELADLMGTRREIERLCLQRALAHGGAGWETEIVASLHMLSRTALPANGDDREGAMHWEVQHRRFHFALVAACPSAWLLRFWNTLADHSERYRKVRLLHHRQPAAMVRDIAAEHAALADAALARDAGRAAALMDAHLSATEVATATFLLQDKGGVPC